MDEKDLKTSVKQRIGILAITFIMLGSIIAGYAAIVISGSSSSDDSTDTSYTEITDEKKAEYTADYEAKLAEFKTVSRDNYQTFIAEKGTVGVFDEEAANSGDVATKDLAAGTGRELTSGDTDYLAYYIGWCADGSVFDSSLDDVDNPTSFKGALAISDGLITGWKEGVVGMKLGGVRRITIPGEKAYAETREICGGYNKPLRFMVMAVENADPLKAAAEELEAAYIKKQYADYGIDYESM